MSRLAEEGLDFEGPLTRFGAQTVGFRDPDGLRINLVAEPGLHMDTDSAAFDHTVPAHEAIRGLHSVALCVEAPERTARLLTATFGYEACGDEAGRSAFAPVAAAQPPLWTCCVGRS